MIFELGVDAMYCFFEGGFFTSLAIPVYFLSSVAFIAYWLVFTVQFLILRRDTTPSRVRWGGWVFAVLILALALFPVELIGRMLWLDVAWIAVMCSFVVFTRPAKLRAD